MKPSVSLIRCESYEEEWVFEAVQQSLEPMGGMAHFVQPGQRVLLKVNLLRAAEPEAALSTHPAVVKAVIRLVQQAGGIPVIGDSPGGPFNEHWLRQVYQKSGMARLAEETGAELNWDLGQKLVSCPEGRRVKALELGNFVVNADVVITLPKLKTHTFMQFTGATKILFGAIPGTIKVGYHAKFSDPEQFGDMLLDILFLVRPALAIMDGIVGMDGNGPSGGRPFQIGAVLASCDSVALDVAAATLVGLEINNIYPLRAAMERGLTSGKIEDIEIIGEQPANFGIQNFCAPETRSTGKISSWFNGVFSRLSKQWLVAAPYSTPDCVGCGICAQNCPVKAITIVNHRAEMDLKTCIRCYCCHEMCPELAIDLRKPWLQRLLG